MPLLSFEFLGLAALACLALRALPGLSRALAFLAINAVYASSFLSPLGAAATLAWCALGYGAARLAARRAAWGWIAVAVLTALFVWARGYTFVALVLPDELLPRALATAGLSFLFFKILHVVIEAGSGTLGEMRPLAYLNYCLNFTTFLLGPIQRFQQFRRAWSGEEESLAPTFEAHLDALNRVLRGLVKKFVLAGYLVQWSLSTETDVAALPLAEILGRSAVFYLYLYCDFSGYCDVVIGIGRLMGVRPPENFWLPFLSPNVSEYWLRVHRSLTTWLTDYVFNPLYAALLRRGVGRASPIGAMSIALVVTMLVAGAWHGTTFAFVLFGLVHGAYLVAFRLYEHALQKRLGRKGLRAWRATVVSRVGGVALTFAATSVAYLFFALDSEQLLALGRRLVSP